MGLERESSDLFGVVLLPCPLVLFPLRPPWIARADLRGQGENARVMLKSDNEPPMDRIALNAQLRQRCASIPLSRIWPLLMEMVCVTETHLENLLQECPILRTERLRPPSPIVLVQRT
jgi:hypothetical protein